MSGMPPNARPLTLSKLRTLGLLADVSRSEVIATELLFPTGLR